jgi:hypothetical protein
MKHMFVSSLSYLLAKLLPCEFSSFEKSFEMLIMDTKFYGLHGNWKPESRIFSPLSPSGKGLGLLLSPVTLPTIYFYWVAAKQHFPYQRPSCLEPALATFIYI